MSRVISIDSHQDHHTNPSNNTSDPVAPKLSLTDEKNRSVLDKTIKEVKKGFKKLIAKRRELIIRLGNAFESVYASNPESICKKIKNCLQEEIADGIISARNIERHCPDKWKKKTKPKNDDELLFSKTSKQKPQQQIAMTQEGKSVIINGDTEAYPIRSEDVNEPHERSERIGIGVYNNSEKQTIQSNQGKLDEPKANIETSTIDNYSPSDAVEKITLDRSDKQEYLVKRCSLLKKIRM